MSSRAVPAPVLLEASNIDTLPGHFIRRLQQIAVSIFLQEAEAHALTPIQYAALQTVRRVPDVDQRTLARSVGLDTSTTAGVIDRLEGRGLMQRRVSPEDRRARLLKLTDDGERLLKEVAPAVLRTQRRILAPLSEADQHDFMRMLEVLVTANNELSRAPSDSEMKSPVRYKS